MINILNFHWVQKLVPTALYNDTACKEVHLDKRLKFMDKSIRKLSTNLVNRRDALAKIGNTLQDLGEVSIRNETFRFSNKGGDVNERSRDTKMDTSVRETSRIRSTNSAGNGCIRRRSINTIAEYSSYLNYDSQDENYEDEVMDAATFLFSEQPMKQSNTISVLVGVFVAVGGFLFGYDTGLINNIIEMAYVKKTMAPNHQTFSSRDMSILVSFLSMGTFVGALLAPYASDRIGRKWVIMFSTSVIFTIGNSLQVAATEMVLLIIGRVISGIGIGVISAIIPTYQAETVSKNLRGAVISTYQWAITWGLLVSSAVSQGTHNIDSHASYRIPIGLQYIWSTLLGIGMIFLPESPRYFVLKDDLESAAKSLSILRRVPIEDSGLLEELVEIKATFDYEKAVGSSTFLDCLKSSRERPRQTLRMITGIALQSFQQFSGINFIFYYGVNFFARTGIHNSYIISFITYAVNVGFSVPGMFLIEYIGRRKLLLFGGILMTIANFIIAIVGVSVNTIESSKVMIAFICVFIASFSMTWGGVVWVVSAELYPLGVRAKCTAICAASNWLANFICAFITPYIVDTGTYTSILGTKIYFIWGSLNALGVIVVYFLVYETKGLTLEQIDELYECSTSSFDSAKWNKIIKNRKIIFSNVIRSTAEPQAWNHDMSSFSHAETSERSHRSVADTFNSYNDPSSISHTNYSINGGNTFNNDIDNNFGNDINTNSSTIDCTKIIPDNDLKSHIDNPLYQSPATLNNFERYSLPKFLHNDSSIKHNNDEKYTGTTIGKIENANKINYHDRTDSNVVDLGNGLTLNTYTHGPPSIFSEADSFGTNADSNDHLKANSSASEKDITTQEDDHVDKIRINEQNLDMVNGYIAQMINSSPNSQMNKMSMSDIPNFSSLPNNTSSFDFKNGLSLHNISRGPQLLLDEDYDDDDK